MTAFEPVTQLVALASGWLVYALLHSLLAANNIKARVRTRWPALAARYRLAYNLIATVLLLPMLAWTLVWPGPDLWIWSGSAAWIMNGIALAGVAGFLHSSRAYDMAEFLGLKSNSAASPGTPSRLVLTWEHRFVRHPWYFFGLLVLWTRDMDAAFLVTAICASLYFALGSRLEEQKLIEEFGNRYERYRQQVPALIPRPWRFLSRAQMRELSAPPQ